MIVDEPHRLHERVAGRGTDEGPAAFLQILRQRRRLGRRAHRSASREIRFGRLFAAGSHDQKYAASEPRSSINSSARLALLIVDSILPRWRTMPASFSSRCTSRAPKRATAFGSKSLERLAEVVALAEDGDPAQAGLEILRGRSFRTAG